MIEIGKGQTNIEFDARYAVGRNGHFLLFALAITAQSALWFTLDHQVAPWLVMAVGLTASLTGFHRHFRRVALVLAVSSVTAQLIAILYVATTQSVGPWRIAVVGLVLLYLGAVLAFSLAKLRWLTSANAILVCASVLSGVFLIELLWEDWIPLPLGLHRLAYARNFRAPDGGALLVGSYSQIDPERGSIPIPHGVSKLFFQSNPRGYFVKADPDRDSWRLDAANGNEAELTSSDGVRGALRVDIRRATSPHLWDISLSRSGLQIQVGAHYTLHFRVRADRARKLTYLMSEGAAPWFNKGLRREIAIGPQWQEIDAEFTMTGRQEPAKLIFSLGGDSPAVELADVALRRTDNDAVVAPVTPGKYYIPINLNDHGCRGRDYAIPGSGNTTRILVLGNSVAFGWGVKYEDLFTTRAEEMLNASADRSGRPERFEVINCAVVAQSSAEERWFYETALADYRPNILVLTTALTDRLSPAQRRSDTQSMTPYPWERIFLTPFLVRRSLHKQLGDDYRDAAREVLALKNFVEHQGGRLAIAQFEAVGPQQNREEIARYLPEPLRTIKQLSGAESAPMVDLTPALYGGKQSGLLVVYPGDLHPNELVHRAAAAELVKLLEQSGLLTQQPSQLGAD